MRGPNSLSYCNGVVAIGTELRNISCSNSCRCETGGVGLDTPGEKKLATRARGGAWPRIAEWTLEWQLELLLTVRLDGINVDNVRILQGT